jgi:hypothetical protein
MSFQEKRRPSLFPGEVLKVRLDDQLASTTAKRRDWDEDSAVESEADRSDGGS